MLTKYSIQYLCLVGGFSLDDLVVVSSGKAKEEEASPDR